MKTMRNLIAGMLSIITLPVLILPSCFADKYDTATEATISVAAEFAALIGKEFTNAATGAGSLNKLSQTALKLISIEVPTEQRRSNAILLAHFLGQVRAGIEADYKWRPVAANLMPRSAGSGYVFAGMSPDAITDPQARAEYEQALRENRENNLNNERQAAFRSADFVSSTPIVNYIGEAFAGEDGDSQTIVDCIESARLTDEEKETISNRLRSK